MNISLKDSSGQIRDLGDVLDEVGAKWDTFTRNEQNQLNKYRLGTQQCVCKFITLIAGKS